MSEPKPPIPRTLILFVLTFMSVTTITALNQGNTEFLFYAVSLLVIIAVLVQLHKSVHFSTSALWLLTIWGFLHMIGGTIPVSTNFVADGAVPVLYSLRLHPDLPRYDQIIHTFGFFSATVACWEIIRAKLHIKPTTELRLALAVIAAIMGMGLGALNEVLEFIATRFTETNVGGYTNTGWDLVSNTIGTICAGIWCLNRQPPSKTSSPTDLE